MIDHLIDEAAKWRAETRATAAKVATVGSELAALNERLSKPKPGIPPYVNVQDFGPPDKASDAYEKAVQHILDKWGLEQMENPFRGGPGPDIQGFRGTSQLTLPSVYFPPGNYVFDRTLWVLGQIPVVFAGWNCRQWFEGDPANYADDENEWTFMGTPGPQQRGHRLAIALANSVLVGSKHSIIGYNTRIENLNARFNIGPCVGVASLGHHHNARIINAHLVCEGEARRSSVAVATIPSSKQRETPFGRNFPSYQDHRSPNSGYAIHNQDMRIERLMAEYWDKGAEVTGAGLHLEMMAYYCRTGFHYFGQSGFGKDHVRIDAQVDAEGHKGFGKDDKEKDRGFWDVDDCLAGILTKVPKASDASVSVQSCLPVWSGVGSAPSARGGWKKGDWIW